MQFKNRNKFDIKLAKLILDGLRNKGIDVTVGLSEAEFEIIERAFKAQLPPELRILLAEGVPVGTKDTRKAFPQWHDDPLQEIQTSQEYIEHAFVFDIQNNSYWHPLFGDKPASVERAVEKALGVIREWPPLVRVYGHRFIPTEPHAAGNPVLSVWQAGDTVCYGFDLADYFAKEFDIKINTISAREPKYISGWSDVFDIGSFGAKG